MKSLQFIEGSGTLRYGEDSKNKTVTNPAQHHLLTLQHHNL